MKSTENNNNDDLENFFHWQLLLKSEACRAQFYIKRDRRKWQKSCACNYQRKNTFPNSYIEINFQKSRKICKSPPYIKVDLSDLKCCHLCLELQKFKAGNFANLEEVYSRIGLLLLEGRLPSIAQKGWTIGPHAESHGSNQKHVCDTSEQCSQMALYKDHLMKMGRHSLPVCLEISLLPFCDKHFPSKISFLPLSEPEENKEREITGVDRGAYLLEQWTIRISSSCGQLNESSGSVTSLVQMLTSYFRLSKLSAWLVDTGGEHPYRVEKRFTSRQESERVNNNTESFEAYSFPPVQFSNSGMMLELSLKARNFGASSMPSLSCQLCYSSNNTFVHPHQQPKTHTSNPATTTRSKRPMSIFKSASTSKMCKKSSSDQEHRSLSPSAHRKNGLDEENKSNNKSSDCEAKVRRKKTISESRSFHLPLNTVPYKQTMVSPMVLYADAAVELCAPQRRKYVGSRALRMSSSVGRPATVATNTSTIDATSARSKKDLTPFPKKANLDEVISEFEQLAASVDQQNNNNGSSEAPISTSSYAKEETDKCKEEVPTLSLEFSQKKKLPRDQRLDRTVLHRSRPRCTEENFHWRTKLPLQSSPVPLKRNSSGKFDTDPDCSMPKLKSARSALCFSQTDEDLDLSNKLTSSSAPATATSSSNSLLVNFEESMLNSRIQPVGIVDGFFLEIGASGAFCPPHLRLPMNAYFFHLSEDNAPSPYLGHVDLTRLDSKRGYHLPKKGSLQLTLFNPSGAVLKMFVVLYDLSDMPASSQTFLRQRTVYMPVSMATMSPAHTSAAACTNTASTAATSTVAGHNWCFASTLSAGSGGNIPPGWGYGRSTNDLPAYLRYLVHLRFHTTKSGKLYLHTDMRLIFSRDKFEFDPRLATYELRSFVEAPQNPRYSPKK